MSETFAPGELGADGPAVEDCIREALDHLASKPANDPATGQFTGSALASGKTLERSSQFWAAVDAAKRDLLASVRNDSGLDGDAPETLRGLQEGYCEARLFRSAMFVRLVDLGGPITSKGKARALYTAYLSALDRETKLALALGLERKTKRTRTLGEVLAAHEDGTHGA